MIIENRDGKKINLSLKEARDLYKNPTHMKDFLLKTFSIEELEENYIRFDKNLFYGVELNSELPSLEKGFITSETYNGEFKISALNELTIGNSYPCYTNKDFSELVRSIQFDKHKIYIFETVKELFEWLVRD